MRNRVRFIRYLKESRAKTQPEAGAMIGLKRRQSQQLWQHYTLQGLNALLYTGYKGNWTKLNPTQHSCLLQWLDQDDISTQGQLRDWVQEEMGITYSQPGISVLLSRLKVKLKTGQPVKVRKAQTGEVAFKKTLYN